MTRHTRKTSWLVSALLLVALISAGFEMVVAQPQAGPSRAALDASDPAFVMVGEHTFVNINNVTYTSDEGSYFDIFFACSSARGADPLRLTDPRDIQRARAYFNDREQTGKPFEKYNKHAINPRHIAFIDLKGSSLIISFDSRISDAFVQLTLDGADAESFRKNRPEF